MNPQSISLVRNSFSQVAPDAEAVASLFYERLFSMDPKLRSLFKSDMAGQGRMLMAAISFAVENLARPDAIVPALQDMGKRHAGYGVKDEDYDTVGGALLWTLEQGLGDDFTDECKQAWIEAYTLLASVMKG